MKPAAVCALIAAFLEIGATGYFLAAQPLGAPLLATLTAHAIASILCALAGAIQSAPAHRSRAAFFIFYAIPALLLPIGGVLTILAMSLILRSHPKATIEDTSPFEVLTPARPAPQVAPMLEPFSGAMRQLPLDRARAMATGLRRAHPPRPAAVLLRRLQVDDDTEIRFRARGAVVRAIRPIEELLKQVTDSGTLTAHQKLAAADACLDLAQWAPATGANRQALIQNAIDYLQDDEDTAGNIPILKRLARAQLLAHRPDAAETSIGQLRAAGASGPLSSALEAELLFQRRDWTELVERSATLDLTNPELGGPARFWRAAAAPR